MVLAMRIHVAWVCLSLLGWAVPTGAQFGNFRDLSSYFVFGQERVQLKNLSLAGTCKIGVNCAAPNASSFCGVLSLNNAVFDSDAQLVASHIANTGFSALPRVLSEEEVPNCGRAAPRTLSQRFTPPILGDLDGDGNPSCGLNCTSDPDDLTVACGFQVAPVSCNPGGILAPAGIDCVPIDAVLGNGRCDLAAGTYGSLIALDGSTVMFQAGSYVFCDVAFGKNTHLAVAGAVEMSIASFGGFSVSNGSIVGQRCGDLRIFVQDGGDVTFGKDAQIVADVCAPESSIRLGHGNHLQGHFVGSDVSADIGNIGVCCDQAP